MAICEQCGCEFHIKPSRIKDGKGKCCSWECRKIHYAQRALAARIRVECTCLLCGKVFQATPSRAKGARFCSRHCASIGISGDNSPHWHGGLQTFECELCHATFRRKPSDRDNEHVFCSSKCSNIWRKAHQRNKDTDIERLMRAALQEAGYHFQEQIPLCRTTVADFYDPAHQIAVFCDGDYWHNLPEHRERDPKQTRILEANGITVLRFWEREIKSNIGACLNRIADALTLPLVQSQLPIFGE